MAGGAHDSSPKPVVAYIAFGSNLGDREANIARGLDLLAASAGVELLARSSLIATPPIGCPPGSGDFLNGAAKLATTLSPHALLASLLRIERELGRERDGVVNAPRELDLDLLLYGDAVIDAGELRVPHPRLHTRRFVLEPLAELDPGLVHPQIGKTVGELLAGLAIE